MTAVREYIFSVCGAAMICAIITPFLKKKSTTSGIGKLAAGIFLLLTVLRPLPGFHWTSFGDLLTQARIDAEIATQTGEENARQAIGQIITEQTQAYILQKADTLGLHLSVEVSVSDDSLPVPKKVCLTGVAAPYAKQQLQEWICQNLGIAKELIIWT